MSRPSFASRLNDAILKNGTVLCVGIDPHPDIMPPVFGGVGQNLASGQALAHLRDFSQTVLAAATGRVPAIKPQAALFEAYGPGGMEILAELSCNARQAGLLVIMDAKRGDIGSTARAYAAGWLGAEAAFASDALTINPYLGMDSLEPFLPGPLKRPAGYLFWYVPAIKAQPIFSSSLYPEKMQQISPFIPILQTVLPLISRPQSIRYPAFQILALWPGQQALKRQKNYAPCCPPHLF